MLYDHVADLELRIDEYDLEQHERDTSSGFTRTTTVVSLHGDGEIGRGEDVTYDNEAHYTLDDSSKEFPVTGEYTLDEFSEQVSDVDFSLETNRTSRSSGTIDSGRSKAPRSTSR